MKNVAALREILEGWARACPSNFVYGSIKVKKKEARISLHKPLSKEKKKLMRELLGEVRKEVWVGMEVEDKEVRLWVVEAPKKKKRL